MRYSSLAQRLKSINLQSDRTHLVGAYGLGKCQRVIKLLREAGYDKPIYLHGAMIELTNLYEALGIKLGDVRPVAGSSRDERARSPPRSPRR